MNRFLLACALALMLSLPAAGAGRSCVAPMVNVHLGWVGACTPGVEEPVVSFATSDSHSCVVLASGAADCYAHNEEGRSRDRPGDDARKVVTAAYGTCFLLASGNVDCHDEYGRAAEADYTGGDAVDVALSTHHSCILLRNGDVDCRGTGPQAADHAAGDAVAVAVAYERTCIVTAAGGVTCHGDFPGSPWTYGGGGAVDVFLRTDSSVGTITLCILLGTGDVDCEKVSGWQDAVMGDHLGGDAVKVALSASHGCILLRGGNVRCEGWNLWGQSDPYTKGDAVDVAVAAGYTCVTTRAGTVDCYGNTLTAPASDYPYPQVG